MKTRDEIIEERVAASNKDFIDNGPRLWRYRQTYIVGRCREHRMVLTGGLGSMGVGQMWGIEGPCSESDPTFADAPEVKPHPEEIERAKETWRFESIRKRVSAVYPRRSLYGHGIGDDCWFEHLKYFDKNGCLTAEMLAIVNAKMDKSDADYKEKENVK